MVLKQLTPFLGLMSLGISAGFLPANVDAQELTVNAQALDQALQIQYNAGWYMGCIVALKVKNSQRASDGVYEHSAQLQDALLENECKAYASVQFRPTLSGGAAFGDVSSGPLEDHDGPGTVTMPSPFNPEQMQLLENEQPSMGQ
ncbi:hypothetical protein V5T82_03065 [Magnetovibrio sp. PR-2]|uniref:hypothetical protein n=1 Tax=Magnetovibrio sp. PR-2 TaxID=3120356 RepID=UPI002FCE16FA